MGQNDAAREVLGPVGDGFGERFRPIRDVGSLGVGADDDVHAVGRELSQEPFVPLGGTFRVRWADRLDGDGRVWAIESAGGLGYLLAQQLLAVGETVVDVPAMLTARVRVLGSGKSQKSDPNDARSVAIAALRQPGLHPVAPENHAQVLRMLAKRHLELTSLRTQAVCRLHAVVMALRPGGMTRRLSAKQATAVLRGMRSLTPVEEHRKAMARQHLADIRRLDRELDRNRAEIKRAVAASGTTLVDIPGVGPIVAAFVIGYTGNVDRFPTTDTALTTAPPRSKPHREPRSGID